MRNTKTKLMIVMCAVVALMAVGYAAFSTVLTIDGTANIASEWKVVFTGITQESITSGVTIKTEPQASGTSATFDVGLASPGDKIVYKITLANQGTLDAIVKDIQASATDSPAIIFSVTGIDIGYELNQQTSKDFYVTIEFDPNVTEQPEKLQKTLTVNIITEQKLNQSVTPGTPDVQQPMYLSSSILRDNAAYADTDINFGQPSSDTNGKGLYFTSTNTEDNKTTYYFRGDVNNNYVQLGTIETGTCTYNGEPIYNMTNPWGMGTWDVTENACVNYNVCDLGSEEVRQGSEGIPVRYVLAEDSICEYDSSWTKLENEKATYTKYVEGVLWRIVRINEDGSVRLIKNDSDLTGYFNGEPSTYNAGVGYMYGQTDATGTNAYKLTHTNTTDSTAKAALDNWYKNNLSNYTNLMSTEAGFCNDRSIAPTANTWASNDTALGYGSNITYYGAYNRLVNLKKPQFACPQTNDLFTTKSSSKGNNALTYPIGLLTADELEYAGGTNIYFDNESYIVTMSPHHWERQPMPHMWVFDGNSMMGELDTYNGTLYPVINLKGTAEVSTELPEGCTKLNGTEACPYIIKTN